ncbi:hypothetical protein ACHAW6_003934 [Cyclotella cf. meneghiniana]
MAPPPQNDLAVQPSPPLIAALHERLRDPSIVPRFETRREIKPSFCHLIRPRWVLRRADDQENVVSGAQHGVVAARADCLSINVDKDAVELNENIKKCSEMNTIPHRNYLDLRMEQNKMFADERWKQCTDLLSRWKTPNDCAAKANKARGRATDEKHTKQWEVMRSCIKEGLAAYPDHKGLLASQKQMNELYPSRFRREDTLSFFVKPSAGDVAQCVPSRRQDLSQSNNTTLSTAAISASNGHLLKEQTCLQQPLNKGAEGRAQAAMRDALLERSLLEQGAAATSTAADKYPLLPEEEDTCLHESLLDNPNDQSVRHGHGDHSSSSDSRVGSDEESLSQRRHRHRKHKKEHKRNKKRLKHHKHEKKKHRRHEDGHRHHSGKRLRLSSPSKR